MPIDLVMYALAAALVVGFLAAALRVLREYERAVMFTLGRFTGVMGPGLIIMIPIIQQMVRVDLRTRVLDVPPQDLITRDNISVRVDAVVYYRVRDPERSIIQVEDFRPATTQLAQTTLRSVLGQHPLDTLLAERDRLSNSLQEILDDLTEPWGIKVSNVEIKHVDLHPGMIRVIARQAEAERQRRAKVIDAEGEFQAADRFRKAAEIMSRQPQAMQLRYLTALNSVAGTHSRTVVFPLPIDLIQRAQERFRSRLETRR